MTTPETNTPAEIDETRLDEVSGGPIYMDYEGIKGSVTPTPRATSPAGANPVFADGSVRFLG